MNQTKDKLQTKLNAFPQVFQPELFFDFPNAFTFLALFPYGAVAFLFHFCAE
jgi:hypothetical protein